MHALDIAIIVLYLLGIIVLGLWVGRGQTNTRSYFLGGRSLPWWGVGLSIVATETSALTFIGMPAMAYGGDLTFLQIVIGYVIGRIILAIYLVPHYFSGDVYSPYQLLTKAFGSGAGKLCAALFLLAGTLAAGVRVYATAIPLQLMMDVSITTAIFLFVILSLACMLMGGIKSVIWTEAIQFFLFVGGGIFTICYIPTLLEGGVNWDAALSAGKLHWLNWEWTWSMPFNIWMGLIGATFHVFSSHGVDQLVVQRVLCCRDTADGRKALILSAVLIAPLMALFLLCGLALWLFYSAQPQVPELPGGKMDYIFPLFILTQMPVGVKGFLLVAIFAAAMSSVASALSALSSVTVMDFLKPFLSKPNSALRWSKFLTLFWAVALIIVAKASQNQPLIFNWAFTLTGITSGAMLGGLFLALYGKKQDKVSVITGMIVAVAAMIVLQVCKVPIAWAWLTMIGCLITIAVSMGLSCIIGVAKKSN